MKLGRKLTWIYVNAFCTMLVVGMLFFGGFHKGASEGEYLRIVEISDGVWSAFNNVVEEIDWVSDVCAMFIREGHEIQPIITQKILGLDEGIFCVIVNEQNQLRYIKEDSNQNKNKAYQTLAINIKNTLIESSKNKEKGLVSLGDDIVIVSGEKVDREGESQVVVVIEKLDVEVLQKLGMSTKSVVRVVGENQLPIELSGRSVKLYGEYYIRELKDYIYTYKPIPLSYEQTPLYLEVAQVKRVQNEIISKFGIFGTLIILVGLLSNAFVYWLIHNLVIKRIVKMNEAVEKVSATELRPISFGDLGKADEITSLTCEINKMINRVNEVNGDLKYLANYDVLTAILNRRKLMEYMNEMEKENKTYSLFLIDIDHFKGINDNLGYEMGDEVLRKVAQELVGFKSNGVQVGRLGADQFVLIRQPYMLSEQIMSFSDQILNKMNDIHIESDKKYEMSVSVGVANCPEHSTSPTRLLAYAEYGLQQSKAFGGGQVTLFTKEILASYDMETKIQEGIEGNEFVAYYQPIYDVKTGEINSMEALVRWHREEGMIFPDQFIPVAKRAGLMQEIDKQVFVDACKMCAYFKEVYERYPVVSVNVSYGWLIQPDFKTFILDTIEEVGIPCDKVKLEMTEDEIIEDMNMVLEQLHELRRRGIQIALDDFGVGYSSLNYLKSLPIDTLKIDRSLISNIEGDRKSLSIVNTIIQMAHTLELDVVCEGIENRHQLDILKKLRCDKIQGYYFSRPIEREAFIMYTNRFEKHYIEA
ncbi:MAG: putative bifunctional diguanylate cyclase/phosphodiesterase [Cellulosilyticaceae bacterium]